MSTYTEFLEKKLETTKDEGIDVSLDNINPMAFEYQKAVIKWALKKGRCAVFAGCGLGKTIMQLEWAYHMAIHTGKPSLILAPLTVASQTVREASKFNRQARLYSQAGTESIVTCNYESIHKLDMSEYGAIVLDESSILKNYSGAMRALITEKTEHIPYKLACTATPSPNDQLEILNQADWLGIKKSADCLAIWFINDTMNFGGYRLKSHAVNDFYDWVSTWAVCFEKPSDIGFDDDGFMLPELIENLHVVGTEYIQEEERLFQNLQLSATNYNQEKRRSLPYRNEKVLELINQNPNDQHLIWCELNDEADAMRGTIPNCAEVRGSDKFEKKESATVSFIEGDIKNLISKPSIFGYGINFQHCSRAIFNGLSFSFESYYQAVRRLYRFGQTKPVVIDIVIGELELNLWNTIKAKAHQHSELVDEMKKREQLNYGESLKSNKTMEYEKRIVTNDHYTVVNGDCCEEIKNIPDNHIDFSIFSPPFSNLYTYSNSYRDMGNCLNDDHFIEHYLFLIKELYRIIKPNRLVAVHCKQLVDYKGRDGRSGLRDFRGDLIRAMEAGGFKYHSEVTIWKCPVIEMQRTKAHGLLYKQVRADSTYSRQGMAEYLCIFRKWDEDNSYTEHVPVTKSTTEFDLNKWQQYADPVWMDIKQTNVLNHKVARHAQDEKHICPLQLDIIEKAVELWTNKGDIVFSPFTGIGSEGYQSLKMGRRFYGIELKKEYFDWAVKNLDEVLDQPVQSGLF